MKNTKFGQMADIDRLTSPVRTEGNSINELDMMPVESASLFIIKRDGSEEPFNAQKITNAITKAYKANGIEPQQEVINAVQETICKEMESKRSMQVEEIQDLVEKNLMLSNPYIAKKYIIYREMRNVERDKRTRLKQTMDGIVQIECNDVNHSNANMSSHTPAGQMMTFASEITKDYAEKYLLSPKYMQAHRNGDIHIHDLDYYPTKTTTCLQYDLNDLFERGFRTKNGSVRQPQSIQSYATLATIVFQTNQNEQHGGQAIPAFDFFMAPGVRKTFWKHIARHLHLFAQLDENLQEIPSERNIRRAIANRDISVQVTPEVINAVQEVANEMKLQVNEKEIGISVSEAISSTRRDTHQAMEAFIHNLNTMHSRGGNQVVFSSINYGTDTSPEGRMLITELLRSTEEGLGNGEVPIFPIQIFKVKNGVNFSKEDLAKAYANFDDAMAGKLTFDTPNFDLLLEACRTTAKALFPNFVFLDTTFNFDDKWKADDPKRYLHEIATMGCRTRVYENINGPRTSVGRGNLSFTSINFPRLAILARQDAENTMVNASEEELETESKRMFLRRVEDMSRFVAEQLKERYDYQRTALAMQFPFMMSNNVWKGGAKLKPTEQVGDVLKQGTLGIGFIGGHNAMVALYGKGHAESQEAWDTLYEALTVMNRVAKEYREKYSLNYSVLGTPAEGLSGRFTRMDRKAFGTIKGVTDRDYYVNSFHIDVRQPVSIFEKIKLEAPFHALTSGGHITYVELDGEAKKNIKVMLKIVEAMHDTGIGYGSINHPVDTCQSCGYKGVIYDKCPVCQSDQIERLRRITGYLTGTLNSWNSAKQAEEKDRVKHSRKRDAE